MGKDRKIIYAFSISLVLALFGALFLPRSSGRWITALFLSVFAVAMLFLIRKRPILSINKSMVFFIMLAMGAVCLVLYYLTGVHFGFYKSSTPLSINSFFNVVLPIAAIIVAVEIIRYVLLAQGVRFVVFFTYVLGVLSEFLTFSTLDYLTTFNRFMDAMGLYLLPAITANILYNFLAKSYGYWPGIVYRLLMSLYSYVLPIYPKTPDAIFSFAKMVVPLFAYLFISKLYAKSKMRQKRLSRVVEWGTTSLVLLIMLSVVLVISGDFRYRLLVIATPSMTGSINEGDAIIYEEYDGQIITEDMIVVFTKNDKDLVIHRVVDVRQKNGTVYYTTKGDANKSADSGFITDENIRGVVLFRLPNLGQPTLFMRELFS